jgi:hypothetical protein
VRPKGEPIIEAESRRLPTFFDPNAKRPYFKAWVTYKPNGNHYWESFYYWKSPTH